MAREVVIRCDRKGCGSTDETEEFVITRAGKKKTIALCGEHKGPLVELYDLGEDGQAAAPPRRGRARAAHSVVPIEDWEGAPKGD